METKAFEAPALYGDHHVSEVQSILKELPGIEDVYASSAFQAIEVTFDEKESPLTRSLPVWKTRDIWGKFRCSLKRESL